MEELDKVRVQAIKNGKHYGVLIIVNKNGRSFLVTDLEDEAFDLND